VKDGEIFVTQSGQEFFAIFQKARYESALIAEERFYGPPPSYRGHGVPPTSGLASGA
jgi:hypothetical protein